MDRGRQLTRFGAPALLLSALVSAEALAACNETVLLEYDVQNGRYQFEVNAVYIDSGGGQFASGGAPITEWLLNGANTITVSANADSAEFSLYAICEDGSGRRDFDQATITGRGAAELEFDVADPPPRLFLDAAPTSDDGLLAAVEALKSAITVKDADAVWAFHAAMAADSALIGKPVKTAEYQMRKIVENIAPSFAPGLVVRPVLGGRVWEVYGDEFAPPVSATVEVNGGEVQFKTGSFWMRRDGAWSVLVR